MSHKKFPRLCIWGGGSTRVLGHVGAWLAFCFAGLSDLFDTHGGVSAGAAFACLAAAEHLSPIEIARHMIRIRFFDLLERLHWTGHARHGLYSIEPIGLEIESLVGGWSDSVFIIIATDCGTSLACTAKGILERSPDGEWRVLRDKPIRLAHALDGSMCLPGFRPLVLKETNGERRLLWDGGLAPFGGCPVEAAKELHCAPEHVRALTPFARSTNQELHKADILAVDLKVREHGLVLTLAHILGHKIAGTFEHRSRGVNLNDHAGIVIKPDVLRMDRVKMPRIDRHLTIRHLGLVRFKAAKALKKAVIVDAFLSVVKQLAEQGHLSQELLALALTVTSFEDIEKLFLERDGQTQ